MPIVNINDRLFGLQTKDTSYIISLTDEGVPESLYWGKRIDCLEDFLDESGKNLLLKNTHGSNLIREECSSFGGTCYKEASLKITFSNGVRDFRYRTVECKADGESLEIILEDKSYPFLMHLYYEVFPEENIIKKWRRAENRGKDPVFLERIFSGEYGIPGEGYESIQYKGRWGGEFQEYNETVDSGKRVSESLYGLTGHTVNPSFIIHKKATETVGDVYYGALEYSGNFKCVTEAVNSGWLNILIGITDTDFLWELKEGECFDTPAVYAGYSDAGFEKMSHTMHTFCRRHLMPQPYAEKPLPVLYNSWYSTEFDVQCKEQIELAKAASETGVELFVVDDGWFEGRNDDTAGLGDWYVDKEKFPDGLSELSDAVHDLGMDFGLWIEPEMVNPKSRLFQEHPDWIYSYPGREVIMGRNQYELDMSNPEVINYLTEQFDKLLGENRIEYIKWDMNRYASEMGTEHLLPSKWKELSYRNTQGVYSLIRELRKRHPYVEFEACASGGGRVDFGAMRYFDEYWVSDNTDALDRLFIQESYSRLYPAKYMRSWLTDDKEMNSRTIPLDFRMHAAMCGALGVGVDLNHISTRKKERITEHIREYKSVREIIQFGDLYRLSSLRQSDICALQYVKDDKSVLFVFLDHERYGREDYSVRLRGLEADKRYSLEIDGTRCVKTGGFLMNYGLKVKLCGDYDSKMICLEEII